MRRILALTLLAGLASPAAAATISNPIAAFSGLDKITGRITNFDVYMDETVQFGALQITPRVCYTRPPTETQRTSVFLEVDQVSLKGGSERIFTGWMFADSPALHAVDDPLYDVWLVGCKKQTDLPKPTAINPVASPATRPKDVARAPGTPPAAPRATGNGAIITLLDPAPAAETPGP